MGQIVELDAVVSLYYISIDNLRRVEVCFIRLFGGLGVNKDREYIEFRLVTEIYVK